MYVDAHGTYMTHGGVSKNTALRCYKVPDSEEVGINLEIGVLPVTAPHILVNVQQLCGEVLHHW